MRCNLWWTQNKIETVQYNAALATTGAIKTGVKTLKDRRWLRRMPYLHKIYLTKLLHTKETIYWTKGQSLLTSVDTRTKFTLLRMIARTKSYVFTVIFHAAFPMEPAFWSARFMFCIMFFQNRNRAAQIDGFIGEYCGEYFLWRQQENDVTFSFGY